MPLFLILSLVQSLFDLINWVPSLSQDKKAVVAGYPRWRLSRLLFSKQTVMYGLNKRYNGWEGENTGGFGRQRPFRMG